MKGRAGAGWRAGYSEGAAVGQAWFFCAGIVDFSLGMVSGLVQWFTPIYEQVNN